jgi:hypothetical protein
MQDSEQNNSRTSILNELPLGNSELGEAFALILNNMVVQSGITNPKAEEFDVVSPKWREFASKENKTAEDIAYLDSTFKKNINELAQSYILFIAKYTGNISGKLSYEDYEQYLMKYRFGRYDKENKPEYINKVKVWIKNAFNKISAHGENQGDEIIDKDDMSAYLYALSTKSKKDENGDFAGFEINGIIKPQEYAVSESLLFEEENNLFSVKLRIAYKILSDSL